MCWAVQDGLQDCGIASATLSSENNHHPASSDGEKSLGMLLQKHVRVLASFYRDYFYLTFFLTFTPSMSTLQIFLLRMYSVFQICYAKACIRWICFHPSPQRKAFSPPCVPDLSLCRCISPVWPISPSSAICSVINMIFTH